MGRAVGIIGTWAIVGFSFWTDSDTIILLGLDAIFLARIRTSP